MTTLYWIDDKDNVHIEFEGTVGEDVKKVLGDADGLRGGPEDDRGPYVPLRPEHAAELRERANDQTA